MSAIKWCPPRSKNTPYAYVSLTNIGACNEFQIAEEIRHVLDAYTDAIPAVLEIPSKHHPYDPSKDSILRRAKVRAKSLRIFHTAR